MRSLHTTLTTWIASGNEFVCGFRNMVWLRACVWLSGKHLKYRNGEEFWKRGSAKRKAGTRWGKRERAESLRL